MGIKITYYYNLTLTNIKELTMVKIKLKGNMIEVPISPEQQEDYGSPDGTATEIVTASQLNKIPKDEFFKLIKL